MKDDIMQQLWSWSVHTGDPLFAAAADEIERLTNMYDRIVAELTRIHLVQSVELDDLRALIAAWADAETADGFHQEPECNCGAPLCTASTALRKAVGR